MTAEERFWSKVDVRGPDECWLWMRGCGSGGYGQVWREGRNWQAHRVAYEFTRGPIPDGLWVLHRCDVPNCVNPAHLYVGTHKDNVRDRVERGRSATGDRNGARLYPDRLSRGDRHHWRLHPERIPCGSRNGRATHPERTARGERVHQAKLTESDVREILRLRGRVKGAVLARRFGVSRSAICKIQLRKTWKHVDG